MLRGIYMCACSLAEQMVHADLLASNLANASTPGYRRLVSSSESFPELISATDSPRPGTLRLGVTATPPLLDLSPGPIRPTDNPLDLALTGPGFFVVRDPSGRQLYTRAGNFSLDSSGRLVTREGFPVLSDKGEIRLPPGKVTVAEDGTIAVDGKPVAKLQVVTFSDATQLVPAGSNYYSCPLPPQPLQNPSVVQGAIETSNVNPASELSRMMAALRIYEANVRAMSLQDATMARLLQAVS